MSGGGGGGGASPPGWLEDIQCDWLTSGHDEVPLTLIETCMTETLNALNAPGGNPLTAIDPYDPDTNLRNMRKALADYQMHVDEESSLELSPAYEQAAKAFEELQRDHLETSILPQYRAGARDAGMVRSSFYVIGEALLERDAAREYNKFLASLLLTNVQQSDRWRKEFFDKLAHYAIEIERMSIAAKTDEVQHRITLRTSEARWAVENFQYAANLMASSSGGTVTHPARPSTLGSAIGGALQGASMGTMMGGPSAPFTAATGALYGGIAGAAMGLLS